MTPDPRRKGDRRPLHHDRGVALTLTPDGGEPFRYLPRHGDPYCIGEAVSQWLVRKAPVLTLGVVLVSLVLQLLVILEVL